MSSERLTIAARSICPAGAGAAFAVPRVGVLVAIGLGAVGIGGLPFVAVVGFAATGGLGFAAIGGGCLEPTAGVPDELTSWAAFLHGVADPFAGAIPGNTETGLELALASTLGAAGVGTGRRAGGGGGTGADFGFGGTSSR